MDMHKTWWGILVAIVLSVGATARAEPDAPSDAQDPPAEPGPCDRIASLSFYFALQTELVQRDLRLTASQTNQVKQLRGSFEAIIRDLGKQYLELSPDQRKADPLREQIQDTAAVRLKAQVQKILSTAQLDRLQQIGLQSRGIGAFSVPEVVRDLHLSEAQQKSIKAAAQEFVDATRYPDELFGFGGKSALSEAERSALHDKYEQNYLAARQRSIEQAIEVLNADQRRRLDELWGRKIDLRTLEDQEATTQVSVVMSGLTVQIAAGGSFSIGSLTIR